MSDRILVVSDFTGNVGKIERHIEPLSKVVDETTMVCLSPDPTIDSIDYRTVRSLGYRPLDLLVLFLAALVEGLRGDYDGIVCFSLIPYGLFGLCLRPLVRAPVHLGILGIDLDGHAVSWYGRFVRAAFRRFDCISVAGETHKRRLVRMGVAPQRVAVLTNAIDHEVYRPAAAAVDPEYDFAWVGRFDSEKDPLVFVRALAELNSRGHDFRAVMLGDGRLERDVNREIKRVDLTEYIEIAGWVDEPIEYYRRSRIFALTSSRDALALSLLEAMSTGLACVTPAVGNTADVVDHGENGLILPEMDEGVLADAFESLLRDDALRERLGENAEAIGTRYSYDQARDDWKRILAIMHARRGRNLEVSWQNELAND